MARANPVSPLTSPSTPTAQARWVGRVLNMLIAVVGRDSLVGQILRNTQAEIKTIVLDETPKAVTTKKVRCNKT